MLTVSPLCIFQSRKKIVSVHQPPIFVAAIWQEEEKKGNRRLLMMMIGFQLTISSFLLILLLILGWPSPITSKWVGPEEPRLGSRAKEDVRRSEVRSWTMPAAQDLNVAHLPKSIWMMTFDKITSEIAERIKTTNSVKRKRNNLAKDRASGKNSELLRFRKRGWMLPPSKASPLAINR